MFRKEPEAVKTERTTEQTAGKEETGAAQDNENNAEETASDQGTQNQLNQADDGPGRTDGSGTHKADGKRNQSRKYNGGIRPRDIRNVRRSYGLRNLLGTVLTAPATYMTRHPKLPE